jgi:hypothetical protein
VAKKLPEWILSWLSTAGGSFTERYFAWAAPDTANPSVEKVHIYDVRAGKELSMGKGGAQGWPDVSGDIIAWSEVNGDNSWDIYTYNVASRQLTAAVVRPGGQTVPKIAGEWIIYMQRRSSDVRDEMRDLYLYNLNSGEEIHIGPSPYAGRLEGDTYGIANGRVAWIGWDIGAEPTPEGPLPALHVYDLTNRAERTLDLLADCAPYYFKMAGDLILTGCSDGFYGYDLAQDRLFTVPYPKHSIGEVYLSETYVVFRIQEDSLAPQEPRILEAPPEKSQYTPQPARFLLFVVPITRAPSSGPPPPISPLSAPEP